MDQSVIKGMFEQEVSWNVVLLNGRVQILKLII